MLKPSLFPSVPRLYNRIYDKITSGVSALTGCKSWLANKAINTKMAALKRSATTQQFFYDKVVFKKFKSLLGGKVRFMVTGSAPIDPAVLDLLKVAFCCWVVAALVGQQADYGRDFSGIFSLAVFSVSQQDGEVGLG